MQKGGSLIFVILICAIALASRCIALARAGRRAWRADPSNQWITGFAIWAVLMLVVFVAVSDMSLKRASYVFPIFALALGVSVSRISHPTTKTTIAVVLMSVIAVQLAMGAFYVAKAHREWRVRDPEDLRRTISAIPRDKRIAGVSAFWLAATEQARPYRLIELGFALDHEWRSNTGALARYDVVFLREDHPLLGDEALTDWKRQTLVLGGIRYVVLEKDP